MKKPDTKTIFLVIVITLSVCSYGYLTYLKYEQRHTAIKSTEETYDPQRQNLSNQFSDLKILFDLVDFGKRFLPAS